MREEKAARFDRELAERLRKAARKKRDGMLRSKEAVQKKVGHAASATLLTNRPAPGASTQQESQKVEEEMPPSHPSQLEQMRTSLAEQASAARNLMLSQCETMRGMAGMPDLDPVPPPPMPPTSNVEAPTPKPETVGRKLTAKDASVLRAVVATAARADREAARTVSALHSASKPASPMTLTYANPGTYAGSENEKYRGKACYAAQAARRCCGH